MRYWPTRHVASTAPAIPDALTEAQLGQWKLLDAFQRRLAPHLARRRETPTEADLRRTLFAGQYVSLLLFGLLNPVLKTTRALCAASHFKRVQAESDGPPVSLASFSAMQQVVEPELLAGVLRQMSSEALPVFGEDRVRQHVQELIANDGTLLPALPRMVWARSRRAGGPLGASGGRGPYFSPFYQSPRLGRRIGRADLPLPVADRTVFQVDQMRAGLSALDGGVPSGHDPPGLLRAHRLGVAGPVDRA